MVSVISYVEELLLPQCNTQWICQPNEMFTAFTSDKVSLRGGHGHLMLDSNKAAMGRDICFYNEHGHDSVRIWGIKYRCDETIAQAGTSTIVSVRLIDSLAHIKQYFMELTVNKSLAFERINELEWKQSQIFGRKDSLENPKQNTFEGKIDNRLILVNRHIRMYYDKPLCLQDLAELIQCNPVYLSNTYSKVYGISPIKHLQNFKMKRATELLQNSALPVGEIANKLGYVSSSQFASLFKAYYGLTPTKYRRNRNAPKGEFSE
jgi:YesN/AraC family two-component response regulator